MPISSNRQNVMMMRRINGKAMPHILMSRYDRRDISISRKNYCQATIALFLSSMWLKLKGFKPLFPSTEENFKVA